MYFLFLAKTQGRKASSSLEGLFLAKDQTSAAAMGGI